MPILDAHGRPYLREAPAARELADLYGRPVRAAWDIGRTTDENAAHWTYADNSDADRANSPVVRANARNRSRHECQNNPVYQGIVLTIANYEVGQGPTLSIDAADEAFAREVETRWREWADAINFAPQLHTAVQARVRDGEGFGWLVHNERLEDPVKLDWVLFECDMCMTPWLPYMVPYRIDGVWFDEQQNPTFYDILKFHPGGVFPMPSLLYDTVPAQYITHLFRQDRARQHRGMPELGSAIELFADRRDFRKATIRAAETAADIVLGLETNMPPNAEAVEVTPGQVPIPRGSMVAFPEGWAGKQIAAEHPNGTYGEFQRETLSEASRCANMPLNIAKCDSAQYNFASGRLDVITFYAAVGVNQANNTRRNCEPVFRAWYAEARIVHGWRDRDGGRRPAHQWLWPGQPYSDPVAEQEADRQAIVLGGKGIQEIYARRGLDWSVQAPKNAKALGFKSVDEYLAWLRANLTQAKGGSGETGDRSSQQSAVSDQQEGNDDA